MFDCVYPTRTARFGVALVSEGTIRVKSNEYKEACGVPIDKECSCSCCACYSRAALHTMFKANNPLGAQLLTTHNIAYMMRLMRTMREAITQGREAHVAFIRDFLKKQFTSGEYTIVGCGCISKCRYLSRQERQAERQLLVYSIKKVT